MTYLGTHPEGKGWIFMRSPNNVVLLLLKPSLMSHIFLNARKMVFQNLLGCKLLRLPHPIIVKMTTANAPFQGMLMMTRIAPPDLHQRREKVLNVVLQPSDQDLLLHLLVNVPVPLILRKGDPLQDCSPLLLNQNRRNHLWNNWFQDLPKRRRTGLIAH
jgi:hypothetical protein